MAGKGKADRAIVRIGKGIGVELGVCILLLSALAVLLCRGILREAAVNTLMPAAVILAVLIGCALAVKGRKENRAVLALITAGAMAVVLLLGRWMNGGGQESVPDVLLLVICTMLPAVVIALKRPRRRKR